jgi:dipeptidyl aminopeptidase/acylaminoacyl peptidase
MNKQLFYALFSLTLLLSMISCSEKQDEQQPKKDTIVEFKGRQIDLEPYFKGFPYSGFTPMIEYGKLYYYHNTDAGNTLMVTDLTDNISLENGKKVIDLDFSKRNTWGFRYRELDNSLYWLGDEKNDEVMNLFKLNLESQKIEKMTDVEYSFGWSFDPDKKKIAHIVRLGVSENRLGEIRIIDLESGNAEKILQDIPELRFSWSSPSWKPDGSGFAMVVNKNAHRKYANIVYIDIKEKTMKLLTDSTVERNDIGPLSEWISDNEFAYISNEDGYINLYIYDMESGKSRQLTKYKNDLDGTKIVEVDGKKMIFALMNTPVMNKMFLFDPEKSEPVIEYDADLNYSILDAYKNKIIIRGTDNVTPFKMNEITIKDNKLNFKTILQTPQELLDKIVHAKVEKIQYPTFDIDDKTGKQRMLHGYLFIPDNPLPKDQQICLVHSFYGGGNYYLSRSHILGEAGVYIFSPSPRGSSGFGKDFEALNDKDLGGNEIIDIIYAGKYISEKLGIPPQRIGVFGGSHGGYAVMRLLTFPGEINGNEASFDWGFGMSHAGFSDIISFYEFCNIPDWVILEAGDPATEADKINDRSPIYDADMMKGKLLLTHGENDSRVPIEGSQRFADSLKKYGKNVKFVVFEGQGHSNKGLQNNLKFYKTWFDFLDDIK